MHEDDPRYSDWKKGDTGYIDRYITGGDDVPCCVVVIGHRLVLCPVHAVSVIQDAFGG